jgi:hypothetical protein
MERPNSQWDGRNLRYSHMERKLAAAAIREEDNIFFSKYDPLSNMIVKNNPL